MSKAIYDDEQFYNNYIELRSQPNNYNDLIEQPNILRLIGDVAEKKVLDIGCGFGTLTAALSKLRVQKIVGIDNSLRMLNLAKKMNNAKNVEYQLLNAEDVDTLDEKFDIVCSSLTFHYIEDFSVLIKKIRNILNKDGQLIFSQEHPILTAGQMSVTITDLTEGINLKNYSRDGERRVQWLGKEIIKYHRKISTIINALDTNGFVLNEMVEPTPSADLIAKHTRMLAELQRPSYLMIKATRRDKI
jgi:SAM-dependent methyltransferase